MNSKRCSRTKTRQLSTSLPHQVFRLLQRNRNRNSHHFQIMLASRTTLYQRHLLPSIHPTLDSNKITNHLLRSLSPGFHHLLKASSHQSIPIRIRRRFTPLLPLSRKFKATLLRFSPRANTMLYGLLGPGISLHRASSAICKSKFDRPPNLNLSSSIQR